MLMLYALAWPERDEGKAEGKGGGTLLVKHVAATLVASCALQVAIC